MIKKYRKRPVVIEAVQWDGNNIQEIVDFVIAKKGKVQLEYGQLSILTLEGTMIVAKGDYVIKGTANEYYPCKFEIFEKIYEVMG